jgi:trk system potassium uptake protein
MGDVHVIVVGCGRVGSGLAIALEAEGHSVVILDKQAAAFRRLPATWVGRKVEGFGFDKDALEEAGIREAAAVAAVTSGDNSNILTARIARETYEVPAVVARIYDPRRAEIYQRLGIQTVATVTWTTNQVLRRLVPERTSTEWADPSDQVHLVERVLPDSWAGGRLGELEQAREIRLVAITRAGAAHVATSDLIGQEGDVLHIAVAAKSLDRLEKLLDGQPGGGR